MEAGESDHAAISRPANAAVHRRRLRQSLRIAAVCVHHVHIRNSVPQRGEGYLLAVRGPPGILVPCRLVRQVRLAAAVYVHHVDLFVAVPIRSERYPSSGRRQRPTIATAAGREGRQQRNQDNYQPHTTHMVPLHGMRALRILAYCRAKPPLMTSLQTRLHSLTAEMSLSACAGLHRRLRETGKDPAPIPSAEPPEANLRYDDLYFGRALWELLCGLLPRPLAASSR